MIIKLQGWKSSDKVSIAAERRHPTFHCRRYVKVGFDLNLENPDTSLYGGMAGKFMLRANLKRRSAKLRVRPLLTRLRAEISRRLRATLFRRPRAIYSPPTHTYTHTLTESLPGSHRIQKQYTNKNLLNLRIKASSFVPNAESYRRKMPRKYHSSSSSRESAKKTRDIEQVNEVKESSHDAYTKRKNNSSLSNQSGARQLKVVKNSCESEDISMTDMESTANSGRYRSECFDGAGGIPQFSTPNTSKVVEPLSEQELMDLDHVELIQVKKVPNNLKLLSDEELTSRIDKALGEFHERIDDVMGNYGTEELEMDNLTICDPPPRFVIPKKIFSMANNENVMRVSHEHASDLRTAHRDERSASLRPYQLQTDRRRSKLLEKSFKHVVTNILCSLVFKPYSTSITSKMNSQQAACFTKISFYVEDYPKTLVSEATRDKIVNAINSNVSAFEDCNTQNQIEAPPIIFPSVFLRHGQLIVGCQDQVAAVFLKTTFDDDYDWKSLGFDFNIICRDTLETITVPSYVLQLPYVRSFEEAKLTMDRKFKFNTQSWQLICEQVSNRDAGEKVRFLMLIPGEELKLRLLAADKYEEVFFPTATRQPWTLKYILTEREMSGYKNTCKIQNDSFILSFKLIGRSRNRPKQLQSSTTTPSFPKRRRPRLGTVLNCWQRLTSSKTTIKLKMKSFTLYSCPPELKLSLSLSKFDIELAPLMNFCKSLYNLPENEINTEKLGKYFLLSSRRTTVLLTELKTPKFIKQLVLKTNRLFISLISYCLCTLSNSFSHIKKNNHCYLNKYQNFHFYVS